MDLDDETTPLRDLAFPVTFLTANMMSLSLGTLSSSRGDSGLCPTSAFFVSYSDFGHHG